MENTHMLFHSVNQLSRRLTKHLNEALEPHGLYSAQWSVLYVLREKGTLTQKELGEYLAVEAPPMTRTIQRLLKQGFIQQTLGEEDKRKKYIMLSQEAEAEFPVWEKAVLEKNEELIKKLSSASQESLQKILNEWLKQI
ncbi:MarR family transcriptional regulator [Rossellomorea vietnamensis]|uniref:MarR family transcriptional regulator n=1 Tax=Rossellomorea vietnamensis TaxID=218284 RepID=A0A5D4KCQ5_9BACI|nr:MarR family transcriptional regulator [Rossellomorea vietnamensis]TYR74669.1 MarR family transcriptional regulator [Rossellomorea vietnamensis]